MSQDRLTQSREEKVRRTIAEINHVTDAGDFDAWVKLFTEDGSFHMFGRSITGHAALRAFIEDDQKPSHRGLHLTTDSVIDFDGESAIVRSNFLFVASGETSGVVVAGGKYLDVLVPQGERWLFQERETVLFAPTATQPWGPKGFENPAITPWFAVTRATPLEQRGSFPGAEPDAERPDPDGAGTIDHNRL